MAYSRSPYFRYWSHGDLSNEVSSGIMQLAAMRHEDLKRRRVGAECLTPDLVRLPLAEPIAVRHPRFNSRSQNRREILGLVPIDDVQITVNSAA